MDAKLTFDLLPILALVLALAQWFLPKFKDWYENLPSDRKQLFSAGVILAILLVTVVLSIFDFVNVYGDDSWTWKEWIWFPACDYMFSLMSMAGLYVSGKHIANKWNGLE